MSRAISRSISASVPLTLTCADATGSAAQGASRATAAKMHAALVPAGGSQPARSPPRSSGTQPGSAAARRRVVATMLRPRFRSSPWLAAPISESPPTNSHMISCLCPAHRPLRARYPRSAQERRDPVGHVGLILLGQELVDRNREDPLRL